MNQDTHSNQPEPALGLFGDISEPAPSFEVMSAPDRPALVVSLGLGRDSVAMLVLLWLRGIRPDLILFADTRGEKPETYAYLSILNKWLASVGFPLVTVLSHENGKRDAGLEGQMLRLGTIPSVAYNKASCSDTWKQTGQKQFVRGWQGAQATFSRNRRVVFAIGYEADECRRVKRATTYTALNPSKHFAYWYPLVEEGVNLAGCIELIVGAGLPVPLKSACFFCPSSGMDEVVWLAEHHPGLFFRALVLEARAMPKMTKMKGLGGRGFAWRDLDCAKPYLEAVDALVAAMPPTESKEVSETSPKLRRAIERVLAIDDDYAQTAAMPLAA